MKNKIIGIIEGAIIVVLGILLAVKQEGTVDVYFGVVFMIMGILLLGLEIFSLIKVKAYQFSGMFLGISLIAISAGLFMEKVSFQEILKIALIIVFAFGIALTINGIFVLIKGFIYNGVGQIVIGALITTLSLIYAYNEDFHDAFWIIVGVIVAIYGVILIFGAIFSKKLALKKAVEKE
ncbi:MAG: hypothetical protein K6C32_01575 [Bacilli bacterium]|nr:hypothetical protein [Bacilli bacterium]